MIKRKPGFMGLAEQNARVKKSKKPMSQEQQQFRQQLGQQMQADRAQEQGMVDKMSAFNRMQQDKQKMMELPQEYEPSQGGEMETLAYVNPREIQMLKRSGGAGEMTEYGIPSFAGHDAGDEQPQQSGWDQVTSGASQMWDDFTSSIGTGGGGTTTPSQGGGGGGGGGGAMTGTMGAAAQARQEREAVAAAEAAAKKEEEEKVKKERSAKRTGYIEGVMTDESGKKVGEEGYDASSATMQGGYEGYKGEYKGLGKEAKDITGEFGKAAGELGKYQEKFDTMAGEAKTRGDTAATKYADEAGKGTKELRGIGKGYKDVTGQGMVDAAEVGQKGFEAGAEDVAGVQKRFGEEGYEKDVGGYESKIAQMGEKAMSGDVGQRQAAMLKGQMEEGRMASQKGSEEKLRRSLAQSGASPSEIASKVAQFQKQSAGQQAQAGRSEALSSQLQGQQMGQAQMGQAAGLMGQGAGMAGQRAGMAGQQASLGAQQAALRGQGAAMQMQGAQGQQQAQLASLQGQGAMAQGAAQMGMQGVQGGAQLGFQGAAMQGQMLGQGMGAIQAASGQRQAQLGGVQAQAGMIGEQAGMTQAQLNDVMAQQTQAYQAEQTDAQRAANAAASSGGGGGGGGGILGKLGLSDIRLKNNIQLLQEGKDGDPNIYSFKYKWDTQTTWSGVMAQELLNTKHADTVSINSNGYYMVDYHKLGIPMTQLSIEEKHGI